MYVRKRIVFNFGSELGGELCFSLVCRQWYSSSLELNFLFVCLCIIICSSSSCACFRRLLLGSRRRVYHRPLHQWRNFRVLRCEFSKLQVFFVQFQCFNSCLRFFSRPHETKLKISPNQICILLDFLMISFNSFNSIEKEEVYLGD